MPQVTRRQSLLMGAAALAAPTIPLIGARAADLDVPTENVAPLTFKPESGATLRVLRPAKFVEPDEVLFRANTKKFTDQTGIDVRVDFVSWEDLRPQTAVAGNTGAGPDIIIGFGSDPQIYADKLVPVTDLAEYLGTKYGGWYELGSLYGRKWNTKEWLAIPMGGSGGASVYRTSWLKEVGYDKIPNDLAGFLDMAKKLKAANHPVGFALGHAVGDGNGFANWLLWSHGAALTDEKGKVSLDTKETIEALKYARELYPQMIQGTLSWGDPSNNKAFVSGDISLTFNGVSIYFACKNSQDPKLQEIAADINHQLPPFGVAKRQPQSALVVNAMVFKHTKYPNAAKEYLRFMMEAPQYGPWLAGCLGYWSNSLKNYAKMAFWDADPKLKPYLGSMDTPYYDGYHGPITAASSAVAANYTLVDMFASVASGNATPEAAVKQAARQAARYLKG
ncbi:MAG: extracellular solute-binding protein [Rhodospirillales bacterium]|nr:extracellular solute-binding protein [Rhodospirillales bacterium]